MSLSLHGERKGPKERPVRKKPTVSSLRIHHPTARTAFAMAKAVDRAQSRQDPITRSNGRVPSARNSSLCFGPKLQFALSDKGKPWVVAKRIANRAVVTLTTVRLHGKLRPYSVSSHFALAKWHADQAIGSLRKVPWVLSLSGALLVLFSRHREKST